MKTLAIVGYPIGHTLSPAIYNAVFPAMAIEARYEAWSTPSEDLSAAVQRLRRDEMMGMNVTVPHKQAVIPLLDDVDATAAAIGAVNCISRSDNGRLVGHNTDCYGFVRSMREAGFEATGRSILILGAGGSARAIAYGLAQEGAASLTLASRSVERLTQLVQTLTVSQEGVKVCGVGWQDEAFSSACQEADLIVNCTPVGMRHTASEAESPLPARLLRRGLWLCDLVYNPEETRLIREARQAGCYAIGGLEMLIYQAAESVRLWTNREAPVDIMREAARDALRVAN